MATWTRIDRKEGERGPREEAKRGERREGGMGHGGEFDGMHHSISIDVYMCTYPEMSYGVV